MATAFLAINIPPFQNPDEPAHFMRAAQVADGGLVGIRFLAKEADGSEHLSAGGLVDPALQAAFYPFYTLIFQPDTRVTRSSWAPRIHWSDMRVMGKFPNTAIYPPLFYAPSAIAVLVGRVSRMTVVQTLMVARLLTGVTAVAVGAMAIACAGGAAVWIFAILTLPMSLSLIASSSQDALLLACAGLAGAMLVRELRWPGGRNWVVVVALAAALSLVAMARPPYGALAILPLAMTQVRLRWRILAVLAVAACVTAWSGIAAATALVNVGEVTGADPAAQMSRLRGDPLLAARVAWQTLTGDWRTYLEGFVGRLGWLDTELPDSYLVTARAMIVVAALAAMLGLRGERIGVLGRLVIAVGLLLSVAGVFAIQYITWTVPGNATVDGVQGRYLLPLALAGPALLPALGGTRWAERLHRALVLGVVAFPVISLAVVMRTVVLRYYLG